jgi:uracil-DNA glycosylase
METPGVEEEEEEWSDGLEPADREQASILISYRPSMQERNDARATEKTEEAILKRVIQISRHQALADEYGRLLMSAER